MGILWGHSGRSPAKNEELLYQVIGYRPPAKFLKEINLDEDEDDL